MKTLLFKIIKPVLFPVSRLEALIPKEGRIADLGCGNGFFSEMLAQKGPRRSVTGYDWDEKRLARSLALRKPNLQFRVADILQAARNLERADHILISDVLYLLDFAKQEEVLASCYAKLPPRGILFLKICDTEPRWKLRFEQLQENLAVFLFSISKSGGRRFYHRSGKEYASFLKSLGFDVSFVRLDRFRPWPHAVLIARKDRAHA